MKFLALTALCLLVVSQHVAGLDIKPEQATAATDLLSRTKTIALARVKKAEVSDDKGGVTYTFSVIKKLKGDPGEEFTIAGDTLMSGEDLITFDHHSGETFWKKYGGRSYPGTDEEIHPTFAVGAAYLVFLEKPYHLKSFEYIIRTHGDPDVRDKWLQWVEKQLEQNKAEMATPRKPSD